MQDAGHTLNQSRNDAFVFDVFAEVAREQGHLLLAVQKKLQDRGCPIATLELVQSVLKKNPDLIIKALCSEEQDSTMQSVPILHQTEIKKLSPRPSSLPNSNTTTGKGATTLISPDLSHGDYVHQGFTLLEENHWDNRDVSAEHEPALQDEESMLVSNLSVTRRHTTHNFEPEVVSPKKRSEKKDYIVYHGGPSDELNYAVYEDRNLLKPADKFAEQPKFPIHSIINVTLLEYNGPNDILLRRNDLNFAPSFIEKDMVKWYKEVPVLTKMFECSYANLQIGRPVVHLLNGVCKRAVVTSISYDEDLCNIVLVDYGIEHTNVQISRLTLMSATHAAFPPLVTRISLNMEDNDQNRVLSKEDIFDKWTDAIFQFSDEIDLLRGYVCGDLLTGDMQISLRNELNRLQTTADENQNFLAATEEAHFLE